jgi:single-strand DNA-binding protein
MIHATILGRLGRDPELKQLSNGPVLNFSLATDHGYKDAKETMWIRCAIFGKRAEVLSQYLAKGSQVLVQGELYTRTWEKKDGTTATELECRVAELEFAGGKSDSQQSDASDNWVQQQPAPAPAQRQTAPVPQGGFRDDDVPFGPYLRGTVA